MSGRPKTVTKAMIKQHSERLRLALHAVYGPQINQADAARRSGVPLSRISDVLAARRPLSREDLQKLAMARGLRISADYLLGVPSAAIFVTVPSMAAVRTRAGYARNIRVAEECFRLTERIRRQLRTLEPLPNLAPKRGAP